MRIVQGSQAKMRSKQMVLVREGGPVRGEDQARKARSIFVADVKRAADSILVFQY